MSSPSAVPTPLLTTERLILRPLQLADAAAVQAVFPQWEVVRYLAAKVPWPYPANGALVFIREALLPTIERGTQWHWSIRPRAAADQLIGVIGLIEEGADNRGFWLDPAWQGRGLMSEAVTAVTDFWFDVLRKDVLRVPKAIANTASRRISERTGMRIVGTEQRDFVGGRLAAEIWEITRDEWRARRSELGARPDLP
jgi:RimJ/RimL family protein N-acetyltransferase